MDIIFTWSSVLVMPFWLLMILLPRWRWTRRIMESNWVITPLPLLYTILIGPQLAVLVPSLANPTLTNIMNILGEPAGATIGWIHFLAFDLFVGRWAYLDSREHHLTAWLASPVLFFILMAGPFGLLLYLLTRTAVFRLRARKTMPAAV
jgi:hypothetical protein